MLIYILINYYFYVIHSQILKQEKIFDTKYSCKCLFSFLNKYTVPYQLLQLIQCICLQPTR